MKRFLFFMLYAVTAMHVAAQSDSFAVFYATGKYKADVIQKARLDSFLQTGKLQQAPAIVVVGYGDKTGGDAVNKKLSQQRADDMQHYLTARGIAREKILFCYGFGIRNPNAASDTSAADRRVNMLLMHVPPDNNVSATLSKLEINQTYILQHINFLPSRHHPDSLSYETLEQLYLTLLQHPALQIRIEGHICCGGRTTPGDAGDVDDEPGYGSGFCLSVNRALFIMKYLVSKGIDPARLSHTGFGNTMPLITPERSAEDQRQNRRVEIRVLAK